MATVLPVLGAFMVVLGMLAFLGYCNSAFDAEAKKVADDRP